MEVAEEERRLIYEGNLRRMLGDLRALPPTPLQGWGDRKGEHWVMLWLRQ